MWRLGAAAAVRIQDRGTAAGQRRHVDGLGRDDEHLAGGAPVDQSRRRTGVDVAVVAVNSRGSGS
jgi:hypothetical protein